MNILFFLTPKSDVAYIYADDTIRQALEKMEYHRYSAVPVLNRGGKYIGTITEGDLLWGIKNQYNLNLKAAENIPLSSTTGTKFWSNARLIRSSILDPLLTGW